MEKGARIQVRLNEKDKKRMEKNAEKCGMSLSEFVIHQCTQKVKYTNNSIKQKNLLIHVVEIQNTLNKLKVDGSKVDKVTETMEQLEKEVDKLWQFLNV